MDECKPLPPAPTVAATTDAGGGEVGRLWRAMPGARGLHSSKFRLNMST